jgi:methyl-accepting chemotaxis protein
LNTGLLPETLSVQRLFGVAVALKIAFALAGYLLDSPVWLGTVVPLTVMVLYMVLGYHRRSSEISEERFADSCYYLGFIFTIASIIICLFDLPKMTPGKGMYQIAVRFGAAMVSTVLGMIVRVYLVGFKKDVSEAVKDVESALIDATRAFTVQLNDTMRTMQQFEAQILDATKASVAGVQLQVEALGRSFADALNRFYEQVNSDNKIAFEQMLGEVKTATARLAASVETYSGGMRDHLQAIEAKVTAFSDAVTARLSSTTFPDDFFSSRLEEPVHQLQKEAVALGQSVRDVARQVGTSSNALGKALDALNSRAESSKATMETVAALSDQQRLLLNNADLQLNALGRLAASLEALDAALRLTTDAVRTNSASSMDLQRQIGLLAQDSSTGRLELKDAVGGISRTLGGATGHASEILERLDSHAGAIRGEVAEALRTLRSATENTGRAADKISGYASELPQLVSASAEHSAKMQASLERMETFARAAETIASSSAESAARMQSIHIALGDHSRGMADANQRLCESHQGTVATLTALLQQASSGQPIATLDAPSVPVRDAPAEPPRAVS